MGLGHWRTFLVKKSFGSSKKGCGSFPSACPGVLLFIWAPYQKQRCLCNATPHATTHRRTCTPRRAAAAVATVVEQLMFVACLGSQQARPMVFGSVALDSFSVGGEEEKEKKKNQKSHHYCNHIHILHIPHYGYTYCFWMSAADSRLYTLDVAR